MRARRWLYRMAAEKEKVLSPVDVLTLGTDKSFCDRESNVLLGQKWHTIRTGPII